MIVFLDGNFIAKNPAFVWMDVNGIGYEVNISLYTYSKIQDIQKGRLLTYLQVKEDGFSLFGFHDEDERQLFMQLISVSGIGASTARMMLSSMKTEEITQAIVSEDEKSLERIKGIGAKSAKRLILELKDKLLKGKPGGQISVVMHNNTDQDALNALVSLGIARQAAIQALEKVNKLQPNAGLEEKIKSALKQI
ncbi:MAG: Holliday junction branch migration protein RuvA [Chitinophagaceae bacterium]|jgi:Holliday junction DNA helicase RuvA